MPIPAHGNQDYKSDTLRSADKTASCLQNSTSYHQNYFASPLTFAVDKCSHTNCFYNLNKCVSLPYVTIQYDEWINIVLPKESSFITAKHSGSTRESTVGFIHMAQFISM